MNSYELVELLKSKALTISTAESVTGGKLISVLIEVPGASNITEQNYVVYSDRAKMEVLNVSQEIIREFGVVSKEVALDMVRNLKRITKSNITVSTTGEAGPSLGSNKATVGTVCIGISINEDEYLYQEHFKGDRQNIINSATDFIVNKLIDLINQK